MKKNTLEEVSFLCFPSSVVQSKLRLSSIDCEMFLDLPILKYFLSANYLIPAQIISVCLVRWLFIIIRTCSHWTHEILQLRLHSESGETLFSSLSTRGANEALGSEIKILQFFGYLKDNTAVNWPCLLVSANLGAVETSAILFSFKYYSNCNNCRIKAASIYNWLGYLILHSWQ